MQKILIFLVGLTTVFIFCSTTTYADDFTDYGDGTVIDNRTGLVWQQEDDDLTYTWENALSYCENLSLDGKTDWRLPSIRELETIVDETTYGPAIDSTAFPNTNSSKCWSSTNIAGNTYSAWYVYFGTGRVYDSDKTDSYRVRCVRGGLILE